MRKEYLYLVIKNTEDGYITHSSYSSRSKAEAVARVLSLNGENEVNVVDVENWDKFIKIDNDRNVYCKRMEVELDGYDNKDSIVDVSCYKNDPSAIISSREITHGIVTISFSELLPYDIDDDDVVYRTDGSYIDNRIMKIKDRIIGIVCDGDDDERDIYDRYCEKYPEISIYDDEY